MARVRIVELVSATAIACAVGLAGVATSSGSGAATCRIGQMRVALGPLVSEKTGQHTATVVLTNRLARPCTLRGYPAIAVLDGRGRKIPFVYVHGGANDQMITRAPPATVRVPARGSAYFAFNKYRCDVRWLAIGRLLHVALPRSRSSRSIRLAPYPILDYCHEKPSTRVAVSPVVARLGGAFAGH